MTFYGNSHKFFTTKAKCLIFSSALPSSVGIKNSYGLLLRRMGASGQKQILFHCIYQLSSGILFAFAQKRLTLCVTTVIVFDTDSCMPYVCYFTLRYWRNLSSIIKRIKCSLSSHKTYQASFRKLILFGRLADLRWPSTFIALTLQRTEQLHDTSELSDS